MKKELYGGHDPTTLVEGHITKVCDTYLVTYPRQDVGDLRACNSVTASLSDWRGTDEPQVGQVIKLVNPTLYTRGWRASEVYPINTQGGVA